MCGSLQFRASFPSIGRTLAIRAVTIFPSPSIRSATDQLITHNTWYEHLLTRDIGLRLLVWRCMYSNRRAVFVHLHSELRQLVRARVTVQQTNNVLPLRMHSSGQRLHSHIIIANRSLQLQS